MTLYDKIKIYENSDLNALYYENKSVSFDNLLINIRKLMNYFKSKGIKKDDVVTIVLPNIPSSIYTFYALNALGVIQNIIHPLTSFENIIETCKNTNSKGVVLLATNYYVNKENVDKLDLKFFFVNPMYDNSLFLRNMFNIKYKKIKENDHIYLLDKFRKCKECFDFISKDEKETSIYLHSGGTTGVPKIICLSDYTLNNLVDKIDNIVTISIKGKSMLAVLPIFHGFGLGMGVHGPLSKGASSALMMKFDVNKTIKWINQNKINLMIGVPTLYQKLLRNKNFIKSRLDNLEQCFIGGDNVPISLINDFNKVMKNNNSRCLLLEGYGLTETITVCSVNTIKDFKVGSIGKPLKDIEIKILDESLNEVNINEIGELYIKGNTLMNGYYLDKVASDETIVNIDDELYIKSGDLGYIDDEGYIFLKGRKKRMFKISGLNVYPSEIEKIATDNEYVIDASLEYFNEPKPHLVLYIIKNKYCNLSKEEIINYLNNEIEKRVLKYSLPKYIVIMDEFPKTKVGKIDHSLFIDPLSK